MNFYFNSSINKMGDVSYVLNMSHSDWSEEINIDFIMRIVKLYTT